MSFTIIQGDLTKMDTDAIVNAANSRLEEGGGVCGAIFSAAGRRELALECRAIGHCETGQSVITNGGALPAAHVIHTVGPVWYGGDQGEKELLKSCYLTALELAREKGLTSIAFPLISSGIFGYPKDQAFQVASSAIQKFLEHWDMDVYLVLFDKGSFLVSQKRMEQVELYIEKHYQSGGIEAVAREAEQETPVIMETALESYEAFDETDFEIPLPVAEMPRSLRRTVVVSDGIERRLAGLEETFSQMLLRLIDEKGMSDVQVYKKANLDRKLFSKIRSNMDYRPKKSTVLAFAIALELDVTETDELLKQAGFAMSRASKSDVIIEYFIEKKIYDIFQINQTLFAFEQMPLGA